MKSKEQTKQYIQIIIFLICITILGCAKPITYHGREVSGGFNLLSIEDEIELGQQASSEIDKAVPLLYEREISGYIEDIGDRLAQATFRQNFPHYNYSFKVINEDVINAFALPGGYIYVYRGLLHEVENESEVAGVLAHEIGHVIGRHGAKIWSKMILLSGIAMVATESIPEKHKKWKAVAEIGGGFALVFTQLKYSRDAEREADFIAVNLMTEAGYHPSGMVTLFQKFEKMEKSKPSAFQTFFSSHPTPSERIKNTQKELSNIPPDNNLIITTANFSKMKSKLSSLPPPKKSKK
jgi:predicted Zn-dependent protease